ncbi:flippase [Kandleria sp.]|jgi:O-antigen/teichoic acid export membrane protein|uniref:flippase n=1 Tax=Kandleria sp. TaxID=2774291 RepID=UPI001B5726AD|nr:flippase [Kandleria sp.]MBP3275443.1 flippase [Kandleria sp.]
MKQPSLKKNFILSMMYQILKIIMPLLTAPYISRVLGAKNIGIYSYTNSYSMYFTLFAALGTVTYGTREIARVRNDKERRSQLFWEIEILTVLTTSAALIFWGIFTFFNKSDAIYYAVLSFNLLAVMFDISWFYAGIEHFEFTIVWNSIFRILSVIAMFLFVKKPSDLFIYIFIVAFQNFAGNVGMWTGLSKFICKIDFKTIELKHHFHETLVYFIPTIATSVYNVLDKTLIQLITHNKAENGYYEQANKILDMMKTLTFVALNMVMQSRISYLFEQKKYDEIKRRIHTSVNYVLFMGIGILFGMMGIARTFVPWFFGPGYDRTIVLLEIMSPVVVIIGLSNCLGAQYYTPSGKRKQSANYIIAGSVINFVLNCLFIPHLMSAGAAIATVIAESAITILYVGHCNRYLTWGVILSHLWRKLIAGALMLAVILFINQYMNVGFIALIVQVGVGFSVYCLMLVILKDDFVIDFAKNQLLAKLRH